MDDFSGDYLIGPINPEGLTNVTGGKIIIKQFAQIGAGSIVFPSITIGEGGVIGAMSLVKKDIAPWTINAGIPTRFIKDRNKGLLDLLDRHGKQ